MQPRFVNTFASCTSLSGVIPSGLFSGLSGEPIAQMFKGTFSGDTGLTGTIPATLFNGIVGTPQTGTFTEMFKDCSGLGGYVPRGLFNSFANSQTGYVSSNTHTNMFTNSGLATECPCGMRQYITYFENTTADNKIDGKVSCEFAPKSNELWYENTCTVVCEAGVTRLKTSNGVDLPLLKHKLSLSGKNLGVKQGSTACWVPLEVGSQSGALNVKVENTTYHTVRAGTTAPLGFDAIADGVLPTGYNTTEQ